MQLDIAINLIYLTSSNRITFYVKSKNIECYPSSNSEEILNQLFDSFLKYFNDKFLICRTDSSYAFESVEGLSIHFHKIDLKRTGSHIPTPKWLKNKIATTNPKNMNDNYCFAYAATIAIFHKEIGDGDRWHFLALKSEQEQNIDCMKPTKSFSKLMRDISNSHENYYCFGCFHSFRCKSTLEKHTQLCKDHNFCKIKLPEKDKKIKEHKYGTKALRMNDIMYVGLECLLVKYDTCLNNLNKSHTNNIAQHKPSGYALNIIRNHNKSSVVSYYRGEDCIQKLCTKLRSMGTELFNTEKVPLIPLTTEQKKQHIDSDKCFICQKKFNCYKKSKYYKNFRKVKDHDHYTGIYRGAAHSICNLRHSTQRDIPIVIHNGSKYDFRLIIKELANEFRSKMHCIPEDKEKYKTFSVPIMYKTVNDYEVPYNS